MPVFFILSAFRVLLEYDQDAGKYRWKDNKILARAYAYRNARSRAYIVCDDDTPVGVGHTMMRLN